MESIQNSTTPQQSKAKSKPSKFINKHGPSNNHKQKTITATSINSDSLSSLTTKSTSNKKAKRLPWNTDVLSDRFTPQPYQVQLVDECCSNGFLNAIILTKTDEWKNYLKLMTIKQYALRSVSQAKLTLVVTNMGPDVSKEVEIISRHTTFKIAGIDFSLYSNEDSKKNELYHFKLKSEAQILLMSVNTLLEWFKRGYLMISEIMLIIFDDVNGAFHNDAYKTLIDSYLAPSSSTNTKSMSIIGYANLCIEQTTTHKQLIKHIDHLKNLFKCDFVEASTDLIDTHNLFNGFQPNEHIQICENVNLSYSSTESSQSGSKSTKLFNNNLEANKLLEPSQFQSHLISIIKDTYTCLDDMISFNVNSNGTSSSRNVDSLTYIHQLCNRVLNECIYLLNEVGIWCFAKSLLPFICQLDKLSAYIENSKKSNTLNETVNEIKYLDDIQMQQQLILQYTATSLRRIRELCIKQFLTSKTNHHLVKLKQPNTSPGFIEVFVKSFTTPKVNSLVRLLREHRNKADEFCCLVFVQNKQVATSLSLLLKKLAKEDSTLAYLYPNYVIGACGGTSSNEHQSSNEANVNATNGSSPSTSFSSRISESKTISSFLTKDSAGSIDATNANVNMNNSNNGMGTMNNDCLKQEDILRKFYSGDINLLICTYEMEEHISVPACVNLIIRFNCTTSTNSATNTPVNEDLLANHSFNYFSYIGTKSRAQTSNANCYFFIEKSKFDAFFIQFIRCKQIEQTLAKNYSKLIGLNQSNLLALSNSRSSLSLANSIQIINKYCIRLPSDALTQLTARTLIQTRNDPKSKMSQFKCTIYLPINSGCRRLIESDWQTHADTARAGAAYKACLILCEQNELNEMLEPITKEIFYKQNNKPDADDEREWSQFSAYFHKINNGAVLSQQQIANYMSHRPGGNKRKQTYTKKVSAYLKANQIISTQHQLYLYEFKCTLTTPLLNACGETNSSSGNSWCFGLLANKLLLEIVDFPAFTQNGEETVSINLVKSGIFLTPNQLKLIKTFHKFLFTNVLRMEGCGAQPMPYLIDPGKTSTAPGCYVCILNTNTLSSYEIDWDLMKSVEVCNDRQFLRIPQHAKRIEDYTSNNNTTTSTTEQDDKNNDLTKLSYSSEFKFEASKYIDSVVIPFYRSNDVQPQFYCVSSIDPATTPLSPFPVSSSSSNSSNSSHYATFYQYFALKYNYLITNIEQPMLIVSHPSTRLNLLTPRYMNMKTNVVQKSYHYQPIATSNTVSVHGGRSKKTSSSKIFLVPELVNVHPFSATVWRRTLCLPSIMYRLNCLLLAEELRREIAQATGVGEPWFSEQHRFPALSFHWDKLREIEICDVPDLEVDVATIKEQQRNHENDITDVKPGNNHLNDSKWNFEISEWDDSVLLNIGNNNSNHKKDLNQKSASFSSKAIFEQQIGSHNGWSDMFIEPKTLFIDPVEMELLAEDDYFMDDESGDEDKVDSNYLANNFNKNEISQTDENDNNSKSEDSFDGDDDADVYSEKQQLNPSKSQFIIDLDKLKADLRKKSAKLLAKLSVNSTSCNLVKSLTQNEPNKTNEFYLNDMGSGRDVNDVNNYGALELTTNGDFTSPITTSLNHKHASNSKYNLLKEALIDETALEWLDKINFKSDSEDENNKLGENIKNKYFGSLVKSNEAKSEGTVQPVPNVEIKLESNYKSLSLPLNKRELACLIDQTKIESKLATNATNLTGTTTTSFRNTDWTFDFSLDDFVDIHDNDGLGPGPALILQALTLSNAADGFDLERLETVGDSFLKQAITVYLYLTYPNVHEGKLSYLRSKQVSNYNLYKLGKRKGLPELIISTKFEPLESWLPPHYDSVANTKTEVSQMLSSLLSGVKTRKKATSPEPSNVSFDKYKDHVISDKSIADCVEAIIGAYLITSGPRAALKIMTWFDLKVLPRAKCEDGSEVFVNMPDLPEPNVNDPVLLRSLLDGYASFEAQIGYKFKQPVYLLQAFTHASYTYNTITDCYQRLEFLGDAILDYVITRYLYEDKKRHSPGELTDLRSSLVNNNIFAYLAVKYEFYKYFRYLSPPLFTIIDNFVSNQKKRNDEFDLDEDFFDYEIDDEDDDIEDEEFILMENESDPKCNSESNLDSSDTQQPINELEEMEVPKCLGDIFESVAGAIFLDSGKSFDTVWRVYYGLMKPHIDKFTSQVPKSPIRELFELEPETAKFEKPERTIDGKIRVTVSIFGRGKFKGVGRNYRIAKNAAAKLALKFLKNPKN